MNFGIPEPLLIPVVRHYKPRKETDKLKIIVNLIKNFSYYNAWVCPALTPEDILTFSGKKSVKNMYAPKVLLEITPNTAMEEILEAWRQCNIQFWGKVKPLTLSKRKTIKDNVRLYFMRHGNENSFTGFYDEIQEILNYGKLKSKEFNEKENKDWEKMIEKLPKKFHWGNWVKVIKKTKTYQFLWNPENALSREQNLDFYNYKQKKSIGLKQLDKKYAQGKKEIEKQITLPLF